MSCLTNSRNKYALFSRRPSPTSGAPRPIPGFRKRKDIKISDAVEEFVLGKRNHEYIEHVLRPEQIGRLTGEKPTAFFMLKEDTIRTIVRNAVIDEGGKQLAALDVTMSLDPSAEAHMMELWGNDTGARPIKAAVGPKILTPFMEAQRAKPKAFPPGSHVTVSYAKGAMKFVAQKSEAKLDNGAAWLASLRATNGEPTDFEAEFKAMAAVKAAPKYPTAVPEGVDETVFKLLDPGKTIDDPTRLELLLTRAMTTDLSASVPFICTHMPRTNVLSHDGAKILNPALKAKDMGDYLLVASNKKAVAPVGLALLHVILSKHTRALSVPEWNAFRRKRSPMSIAESGARRTSKSTSSRCSSS